MNERERRTTKNYIFETRTTTNEMRKKLVEIEAWLEAQQEMIEEILDELKYLESKESNDA
jgi:hypothetical protein